MNFQPPNWCILREFTVCWAHKSSLGLSPFFHDGETDGCVSRSPRFKHQDTLNKIKILTLLGHLD